MNKLTWLSIGATIVGAAGTLLSSYVEDKKIDNKIEEKFNERFGSEDQDEEEEES